jgi:hypothetical protein
MVTTGLKWLGFNLHLRFVSMAELRMMSSRVVAMLWDTTLTLVILQALRGAKWHQTSQYSPLVEISCA